MKSQLARINRRVTAMRDDRMSQQKIQRQQGAIEALLAHGTVVAAAKHCSYSRQHLTRLLREPDFQRRYRQARQALYDQGLGRLIAAMNDTVEILIAYAKGEEYNGKPVTKDQYLGCKAILENCHAIAAGDVESRLAEIEAAIAEATGGVQ